MSKELKADLAEMYMIISKVASKHSPVTVCDALAQAHIDFAGQTPEGSAVRITYASIGVELPPPPIKPTLN